MRISTPILLLCWRRPDTTRLVLERIREATPTHLFIACDGPNQSRPEELEKVIATRSLIEKSIDWPCEVSRLYSDDNQGCRAGVNRAITWFFDNVEEGIILEDDCLPDVAFFRYCQELLERYRHDVRVGQICGFNRFGIEHLSQPNYSYFFSRYGPIWGWASWRRAWQLHDDLTNWEQYFRDENLASLLYSYKPELLRKVRIAGRLQSRTLDTWDYQWGITKTAHSALSIVPRDNLIHNIGFGEDAAHTTTASFAKDLISGNCDFPLRHPQFVVADSKFDFRYARASFPPLKTTLRQRIRQFLCR